METINTAFNLDTFDVKKYHQILDRGLSNGLGNQESIMCIEAAICATLGLPHGDDPGCVTSSVRSFKIALNDKNWSSEKARADALRDLGLAQLGSLDVVDSLEFTKRLSKKVIQKLLPDLFRRIANGKQEFLTVADKCELEGSKEAAKEAQKVAAASYSASFAASFAASYSSASSAASFAASFAAASAASSAAAAAASFASSSTDSDYYLILAAKLALEVLIELKSPGCALLNLVQERN